MRAPYIFERLKNPAPRGQDFWLEGGNLINSHHFSTMLNDNCQFRFLYIYHHCHAVLVFGDHYELAAVVGPHGC